MKALDGSAYEPMPAQLGRILGHRRSHGILAVLVALPLLGMGSAPAQEALSSDPAPTPSATPVTAFPAAEILSRADETAAGLRRIRTLLKPSEAIQRVAEELTLAEPRIRELLARLDAADTEHISARVIEDQRIVWADETARIGRWAERLDDRWGELQQSREQLERLRQQWERTRDASTAPGFPPELAERISEALEGIGAVEDGVRQRSEEVARLTERLSALREMADAARDDLDELGTGIRGRLWVRDADALWATDAAWEPVGLAEQAQRARVYWLETLRRWMEKRPGAPIALVGLFALALLGSLALKRRSRTWASDETLDAARAVAARPLAAATAFFLFAVSVLMPRLPGPILDLVLIAAVFPVLSLGVALVSPAMRSVLFGVAALSLLGKASALGPDGSPLRRLLVLAATGLAVLAAAALRRRWRMAGAASGWRAGLVLALNGALALLLVSLAATLLGWVNLGESLSAATLATAFTAIAWTVAARAALALVPLAPAGAPGRWLPSLRRHAPGFERGARRVIVLIAVALWVRGALWQFQVWGLLLGGLERVLTAPVAIGGLEFSLGRVLLASAVLLLIAPVSRAVRFALREEVLPRMVLPAGGYDSVLTLTHYVVLAAGLVLAARVAGLGATELTVVFGALGVGIGFGLQNVVNNFVSGLILIFERPIKVGDRVETAQHLGIVTRIGIRASTVRTFDGAEVVVPNGDLISKELTNWTLSDQTRRLDLSIGVAYGSDPNRVIEVLKGCASRHPRVLADPPPGAFMAGFGDSALNFRLLAWVRVEDFVEVTSQLYVGITQALGEAGIEIPFPQRDLHVRSFSGPVPLGRGGPAGGDSGSR